MNAKNPILCYNIKTGKTRRRLLPSKPSVKLPLGIEDFQEIRTERFYSYGFSCFWLPEEDPGIVIERKGSESPNLEAACKEALTPIDEKDYAARLVNDGMVSILKYSIACRRNSCMVRMSNCENNISL